MRMELTIQRQERKQIDILNIAPENQNYKNQESGHIKEKKIGLKNLSKEKEEN